ncbi:DJ-1 family glyoxalase III [Anaerocolumna xylanovorans]|uniref:4-methyl-5(B-hydroxyethyl)-thiazole monophosphate biosynthesis n=1 Tax=Anaerocolumna xylanovorans DSM 12503 TaxID=1121345 RepID=A0A1M7YN87_9FIRM|nr:DJ-1 family glyoxalase III [Anaerocolumna xylanovorans]SHO54104.1 4-methyl-5(b-hydroxyethyl)-thiazole monophosphate biosynthesis [Anaerocolumna xylanovorans DSM 12503]
MVYLFLADGFEEIEGLTVVDLLRRAEIKIMTVSVTGSLKIAGAHGINVEADDLFENLDFEDARMLVLPGGMPGTKNLADHAGLVDLLKKFREEDKALAAICAAPSILGENGLLKGKEATCFPGYEEKLIGAKVTGARAVTDGNIITGKGMGTAIDFSLEIIRFLKENETADRIGRTIQYF